MNIPFQRVHPRRYRIVKELKSRAGTTIGWRATDLAFGDEVVIYAAPADLSAAADGIATLEAAFARAIGPAHAGLVRWHSLDLASGMMVREWLNGFTLLELVRRQRKLTVFEAVTLLDGLPIFLDWLSARGLTPPGDLLGETWVTFPSDAAAEKLLELPLAEWPRRQIKLTLLHPRDLWSQYESSSTATVLPQAPGDEIAARMARLLREVLGDRVRSKQWAPLAPLNEKANKVLADTLHGVVKQSAGDFWTAIVSASGIRDMDREAAIPRVETFAFSAPAECSPQACRVAILTPENPTDFQIRLCAGQEFRFGRDECLVDFRTVLLPETSENRTLSNEISRMHARIELREEALWLHDGDGESPSRNGTCWNDAAVSAPLRIQGRGVLDLANRCRLVLSLVPCPGQVKLGERAIDLPTQGLPGAVIPTLLGGQRPTSRAVWVLAAVGFHIAECGGIEWDGNGEEASPSGIFIREKDGFWLGNAGLPLGDIRVAKYKLPPGEAAPLVEGQILRIGNRTYSVSMKN